MIDLVVAILAIVIGFICLVAGIAGFFFDAKEERKGNGYKPNGFVNVLFILLGVLTILASISSFDWIFNRM